MRGDLLRFDGWIFGAAFASGDRFVVGRWPRSPMGSFADVMWRRVDGRRVLLADAADVLGFVGSHYAFDERHRTDVRVRVSPHTLLAEAGPIRLELRLDPPGAVSRLLHLRPRALRTSRVWITAEDLALRPVVSPLLGGGAGIRARGVTLGGAREWYGIHAYRRARASASLEGEDLGPTVEAPPCGFGFSEFPSHPAAVRVTSLILPAA